MKIKSKVWLALSAAFFILALPLAAQDKDPETMSRVAELDALHEVIYPIWHTAYPEKDYAALRQFVPQIEELAAKVYTAKLPGILRDKQAAWNKGVEALKKSVEDYRAAAAGPDDAALLRAAEKLHSRFESLLRLISPVLPDVDSFHQTLYVVYHRYLPNKEFDKIATAAEELRAKAEKLRDARIPVWMKEKAASLKTTTAALLAAAEELCATVKANDNQAVEKAVENLHAKYKAVESVFD